MSAFNVGDLVVERVGTGASALSSAASAVFLDEYAITGGAPVQSIALATADAGTQHALTASGSATSEGLITTSVDGSTLLLAGYDAAPNTAGVAGSSSSTAQRIVGTVKSDGTVDTSTVLTGALGGNNIRGAASVDGSALYAAGAGGVVYTTAGSTAAPASLDTTNTRQIEVVGGQLYYSTGSGTGATHGIYTLGTGTPTSGTQTGTLLPGTGSASGSPYAFAFADLSSSVAGNDTLYVADSVAGIEKFSLVGGTWVANGTVGFSGAEGLVASVSNGAVKLYATNPTSLDTLTDTSGYNATINGTLSTIASAATNTAFRGVTFAPSAAGATPTASVSIGDATYVRGTSGMTETFTVTRSDTSGAFTVNYATADGSAKAGTDYTQTMGTLDFTAGGPATQTISVPIAANANPPASESYTVNLSNLVSNTGNASISKASATGTIVTPTPIYSIQGSGFTSPFAGQAVTAGGVVTALAKNGYYIQDPNGDGNAATSDGLFVFTSSAPTNAVGDFVYVSGTVQEFTASTAPGALSTTELAKVTATQTVSHNNALPAAVLIGPDGVRPPTADLAAGNSFYESLEGMRVTVEAPQAVGPTNSFGEIETVAGNGAGATGLNANGDLLISEGQASFGNTDSQGGDFNPERIKIDSELTSGAVPSVNVGTQFTDTTGILNYAFDQFGVSATAPLAIAKASTLTKASGSLVGDANHLSVASYNIENFTASSGVSGQGPAKAAAVAGQIVNNLKSPDIIALQEVQDNSGPTDDGTTSGSSNLSALTQAIVNAGGPQYVAIDNPFIGNDTNGGQPGGNIRVAYLYNPSRVSPTGALATIAADGTPITDTSAAANADQRTNVQNPFYASRPPLSAQFVFNGQTVTIVDSHFTSKGGSGDLMGSVQPSFNGGEVQRAAQAQAVNKYVGGLLQSNPAANVIVTGDLNEFNGEEPLRVLQGTATIANYKVPGTDPIAATATYTPNSSTPILTDLESKLSADQQYDYIFQGNAESLVHTLASANLAPSAQLQVVHLNSEFASQTSDHDPLLTTYEIDAPACFLEGTAIRTPGGNVRVEQLQVGDLVVTASGALRPIRWLGHRTIDCRRYLRPQDAWPVCIRAQAFAPNLPTRDLLVSPAHAIGVDDGSALIPAIVLVNGVTIVQDEAARVTYWHVELDSHDLVFAENLPCETYIEMDNRHFFVEADAVGLDAAPDAPMQAHADYCRPYHLGGGVVEAVRDSLRARVPAFGWALEDRGLDDLHLEVDGARLEPTVRGDRVRFMVPASASEVWLVCGTSVPSHVGVNADTRRLGACVTGLTASDGFTQHHVGVDDPRLGTGFHEVEPGPQRWTDGRARLPVELWSGAVGSVFLRIDLAGSCLPAWRRVAEPGDRDRRAARRRG